jgi:muramoyltetrapeptide carboxypeptidase LdcA involved in peptidoglycan recycling
MGPRERVHDNPGYRARRFIRSRTARPAGLIGRMARDELVRPRKARPGDRIAVLSPSFAAPGAFPQVHEQAMRRLTDLTGLVPVEYPTTRTVGATAAERAADLNAAFADPTVRAILATIGGDDQITVVPHLDADLARADPKPFLGTSDNTNLHHWLRNLGIASFYGGSSQVHLGPGPAVDDVHARSLRAALLTGETLELTEPGESEDTGIDWADPRALHSFGDREPTEPWTWHGPARSVTGPTWGGCLEVIEWILTAGRFPSDPAVLDGGVLLIETSEELLPARNVGWIVRSLGERGILAAVDAVLVARPPVSDLTRRPAAAERARLRAEQRDTVVEVIARYNPDAVVCVGIPFGHTRPQWILPHGGPVTVDGAARRILADYR